MFRQKRKILVQDRNTRRLYFVDEEAVKNYRPRKKQSSNGVMVLLLCLLVIVLLVFGTTNLSKILPNTNSSSGSYSSSDTGGTDPLLGKVVRLDSALRSQYNNETEYNVWSVSSCSGCSLAQLMNKYRPLSQQLNCGDVLEAEANAGLWDSNNGLHGDAAWMRLDSIVRQFGLTSTLNIVDPNTDNLKMILGFVQSGKEVMIGLGKHILDIDSSGDGSINLVDPNSGGNPVYSQVSIDEFLSGFPGDGTLHWRGEYLYINPPN